jgi:hypothetical protein
MPHYYFSLLDSDFSAAFLIIDKRSGIGLVFDLRRSGLISHASEVIFQLTRVMYHCTYLYMVGHSHYVIQ